MGRNLERRQRAELPWSPATRKVYTRAQESTREFGELIFGLDYLLLGLLTDGSVCAAMLQAGTEPGKIVSSLRAKIGENPRNVEGAAGNIMSPFTRVVLMDAENIARHEGLHEVMPLHILKVYVKEGLSAEMLDELGVDVKRLAKVLEVRKGFRQKVRNFLRR